jgi:hypothetical protein
MLAKPTNTLRFFQIFLVVVALGLLTLTTLVQSNPGTRLPKRDYVVYAYIGQQILRGNLPYRDAWETKPPAIFYVSALGLWLGRGTRWGIFALQVISLFTAANLAFWLMRALWGDFAAWVGSFTWLYGLGLTLDGGNMTEEYPLVLHFFSAILLLKLLENPKNRILALWLGLSFGLSFLFRPNNATPEAALILALFLMLILSRRFAELAKNATIIGLGFAAPIALTALYFLRANLFHDFLEASLLYNLAYSAIPISSASPIQVGFGVFGVVAWLALGGYVFALSRLKSLHGEPRFGFYLALLIGWPLTAFLSDPAKRNYPHYFMNWLPFIALLTSICVAALLSIFRSGIKISSRKLGLPLAGLAVILSASFFVATGNAAEYQSAVTRLIQPGENGVEIRSLIALYAETHTKPGETVLFWGGSPGENMMSRRPAPTAFTYYPLFINSEYTGRYNAQFLHDLEQNKPVLIVDTGNHQALSLDPQKRAAQIQAGVGWEYLPDNLEVVFAYIQEHYYLTSVVAGKNIYQLWGTK